MATHTLVTPDIEPTPEFNARCLAFINGWQQGDVPASEVVRHLKQLARDAVQSRHIVNQARAEYLSGYIQHYLGNLNTSIMHYEKSRKLFDRVGNRRRVALLDINQGENYRFRGDFKRARRLYKQAYTSAVAINDVRSQTIAITNEGLMLISLRRFGQAEDALRQGLELSDHWAEEADREALLTEVHFGLAQIALETNATDVAWEHAQKSLDHALSGDYMHSVGLAYRILGDVLTVLGSAPDDADFQSPEDYYGKAMNTFRDMGAEAEIARTIFSHASSYARRGRRRHAAQLFREAMASFIRLGMTDDAASAAEAQLQVI